MTTQEYLDALRRLGLTPALLKMDEYRAAGELFGLTTRQCQNLASGHSKVNPTLAKLINELLNKEKVS